MTKVEKLRAGVIALVTMPSLITHDPIDTEAVALVDELIAAAKEGGDERLQKYTAEYLKEGIKRCDAALAQGRREGAEEEKKLKWETYLDLLHGNYLYYLGEAKNLPTVYGDSLPVKDMPCGDSCLWGGA